MQQPETWSVILNPSAKGGKAARCWKKLEAELHLQQVAFQLFLTEKPGDGTAIAHRCIKTGSRKILVVGGDGSLNEVVHAILVQSEVPSQEIQLAIFAAGTGNDFVKTWKIPSGPKAFVLLLKQEKTVLQDAGSISYPNTKKPLQYFINVAGIGFDALVAYRANEAKKIGKSGLLTYIGALISGLKDYEAISCTVDADGKSSTFEVFAVLVGLGKFAGSGMKLVPDADPTDGYFHITAVRKISRLKVVLNLVSLFTGKFTHLKEVQIFTAKVIRVSPFKQMFVEADGESFGSGAVEFSILPSRIKITIP
jgi:YegS/Rv2252/BmrU family lipid kinase